jgi:hypothetical protein
VSLPSNMTLCDESIQNSLPDICNQEYTLQDIFSNPNIKFVLKYTGFWSYWDKDTGIKARYKMDKFSSISSKEGFFIKSNASTSITLPSTTQTLEEKNEFMNFYKNGWFLVGVNSSKTISQIKSLALLQNKKIEYILIFRNNQWYIYADDYTGISDVPKIGTTIIFPNKSFWIKVKDI